MASKVGEIYIGLTADLTGLERGMTRAGKSIKKFSKGILKAGAAMTAAGGIMTLAISRVVKEGMEEELATSRLQALLNNVVKERDKNIDSLKDQATALQKLTKFSDTQVMTAQAMILSFQRTKAEAAAAAPRILDIAAAVERTTGQQVDTQQVAIAVGKAINGQAGALTRMGIVLSEETLKSKDFNAIMKDIDLNCKGAAVASGKTLGGALARLKNQTGELFEVLSTELMPIIREWVDRFIVLVQRFQQMDPRLRRFIALGGLMAAVILTVGGALGTMVGGLGMAIGSVVTMTGKMIAFTAAHGPLVIGIGVLVAALFALHKILHAVEEKTIAVTKAQMTQAASEYVVKWNKQLAEARKELNELKAAGEGGSKKAQELQHTVDHLTKSIQNVTGSTQKATDALGDAQGLMGMFNPIVNRFRDAIGGLKDEANALNASLGDMTYTLGTGEGGAGGPPSLARSIDNVADRLRYNLIPTLQEWRELMGLPTPPPDPKPWERNEALIAKGAARMREEQAKIIEKEQQMEEFGLRAGEAIASGFGRALSGAQSFGDALKEIIPQLLQMAAMQFLGPFGGIAGGFLGGLLHFQHGGRVPGLRGQPALAVVHGGEWYMNQNQMDRLIDSFTSLAEGGGGGDTVYVNMIDAENAERFFRDKGVENIKKLKAEGRLD